MTEVLSLGLGVQSTALYYMSALGEIPRIDFAVFADPGRERTKTREYLKFLLGWQKDNNGPEIIVKTDRNLWNDLLNNRNDRGERIASIPGFTRGEDGSVGMLKRQCTNEYKIIVVDKAIREVYGLQARQKNIATNVWKGISIEEATRMSIPEERWKTFIYPLVGYGVPHPKNGKYFKLDGGLARPMNRMDLKKWYVAHGLPIPPKSACVFCPYLSDERWLEMKVESPEDFKDAVEVDHAIRDSSKRGVTQPIFLHRSLKPLDQVELDPNSKIEWGECSGTCGT